MRTFLVLFAALRSHFPQWRAKRQQIRNRRRRVDRRDRRAVIAAGGRTIRRQRPSLSASLNEQLHIKRQKHGRAATTRFISRDQGSKATKKSSSKSLHGTGQAQVQRATKQTSPHHNSQADYRRVQRATKPSKFPRQITAQNAQAGRDDELCSQFQEEESMAGNTASAAA